MKMTARIGDEMQKIDPRTYNGKSDAEHILENIMQRQRWSVQARDEIAYALVKIARGKSITTKSRGKNHDPIRQ